MTWKHGDEIVFEVRRGDCVETPHGERYELKQDANGYLVIQTDSGDRRLKNLKYTLFRKLRMTVNWSQALQIEGLDSTPLPCVLLVSSTIKGNKVVVETQDGTIYAAYKDTGLVQGQLGFVRVTNPPQEWKQAFELWKGQPAEQEYSVEQTFKEAFELGRNWK
jgi:outer membrane protein assembly factor BamB